MRNLNLSITPLPHTLPIPQIYQQTDQLKNTEWKHTTQINILTASFTQLLSIIPIQPFLHQPFKSLLMSLSELIWASVRMSDAKSTIALFQTPEWCCMVQNAKEAPKPLTEGKKEEGNVPKYNIYHMKSKVFQIIKCNWTVIWMRSETLLNILVKIIIIGGYYPLYFYFPAWPPLDLILFSLYFPNHIVEAGQN